MNTITITLTESAQRRALLAGLPATLAHTYTLGAEDLPAALALPSTLVTVSPSGEVTVTLPDRLWYSQTYTQTEPMVGGWHYGCTDSRLDSRPTDAAAALSAASAAVAVWAEAVRIGRAKAEADKAEADKAEADKAEASRVASLAWAALPLADRVTADGGLARTDGVGYWIGAYHRSIRDELTRYCPLELAAAEAHIEVMVAVRKEREAAAKAAELAAKTARRAEIGAVEVVITRGDRDWGVPWGAVVTSGRTGASKDSYDFGVADYDLATETLTIRCQPGDIIAWGQKNYRKPKRTTHERRKVRADWVMVAA